MSSALAFSGSVPVNQLDALPLLTADQLAYGGTVSIISGQVNRYFSPADTGVNGATMNTVDPSGALSGFPSNNYRHIIQTNTLDVRGCTFFTVLLAVKITAVNQEKVGGVFKPLVMDLFITSPVPGAGTDVSPMWTAAYGAGPAGAGTGGAWPRAARLTLQPAKQAPPFYKSSGISFQIGGVGPTTNVACGSLGFVQLWFNFYNGDAGPPTPFDDTGSLAYCSVYGSS